MKYIAVIALAAGVFGVCFLLDKGFVAVFRNKIQHRSGMAVRANKRYATIGLVLAVMGAAGIVAGTDGQKLMLAGGIILLIVGFGLILYYLFFGIFYDENTMLITGMGKKDAVYAFREIRAQKLYQIQGGTVVVELHMEDGRTVSIQTGTMEGALPFLDHAYYAWCRQKDLDPEKCAFHDAANCLWFPTVEDV
jgi:hypothetical protein